MMIMRRIVHRLSSLLAILAFAGGASAFAVPPILADEACSLEHHHHLAGDTHQEHQPKQHEHRTADCMCCCIGASAGLSALASFEVVEIPCVASPVIYPETGARLTGRSIPPDPAPPRPNA
jgi:hypothetical protein